MRTFLKKNFKRSLWIFHVNTGSCNGCDIEIVSCLCPRYDVERLGIKLVYSPKHADVLLITGPVNISMVDYIKNIYKQVPEPKIVIAIGSCCLSDGVFYGSYSNYKRIDEILSVDVYIPGCPPRPEAIIEGIAKAMLKMERYYERD